MSSSLCIHASSIFQVIFTVLVAVAFAAVVPKPPTSAEKTPAGSNDAPSVKEVPLHPKPSQKQQQASNNKKENLKDASSKTTEPKPADGGKKLEDGKHQLAAPKKDDRKQSEAMKKAEPQREGVKSEQGKGKITHPHQQSQKQQPGGQDKEALKSAKPQDAKSKPAERGQ